MLQQNQIKKATYIKLNALPKQGEILSEFLCSGAKLVKKTEPNTKIWMALKEDDKIGWWSKAIQRQND